jgi:hypothetical protein
MPAARHRLATAALLAATTAAAPAHAAWRLPVEAPVTRAFDLGEDPFEGGRHRGVDLAARTGEPVRAPCAGEAVVAGRVGTSGRVVTLRCGAWRVSHMPLGTIAVRRGERVERGAAIGTAAWSREHAGLHLGVRREGDPFGYEDPLALIGRPARRFAPLPRARPRPRVIRPATHPARPLLVRPRPTAIPSARPAPAGGGARRSVPPEPRSLPAPAPWPVWAGLAVLLSGAAGSGTVAVRRRRLAAAHRLAGADAAAPAP